ASVRRIRAEPYLRTPSSRHQAAVAVADGPEASLVPAFDAPACPPDRRGVLHAIGRVPTRVGSWSQRPTLRHMLQVGRARVCAFCPHSTTTATDRPGSLWA